MSMLRSDFRAELIRLEDQVLATGRVAEELVLPATEAMLAADTEAAEHVVARDDQIDLAAHQAEASIHQLIGLQAPVADDLRLLLSMLYALRSIERVGDYAVNLARLAIHVQSSAADELLAAQVRELAIRAERAVRTSLDCFGRRAVDGVAQVEVVEEGIDQLHDGLMGRLMTFANSSPDAMTWSIRMIQAVRHLERVGDHAVGIAELGAYIPTGQRRPPRAAQ